MKPIRVRFAPSPTGYLHLGGLRTALYDYLFARATGGKCILRIEDTDQSREVKGAVENLISTLHQLGIDFDEGPELGGDYAPYVQSQRLDLYHRHAEQLVQCGHAYPCFCDSQTLSAMREEQQARGEFVKYDRRCLSLSKEEVATRLANGDNHVIRLKMPDNHRFGFDDVIRGHVEMEASQSDDQVLIKSDGFPTYHLAATVDDHYMQISHVIRGEEWLSSTPKHIWLYECLGWETPLWVHLPLILNPDRTKLSKRMNDVSVESYINKGYLKEALINFVALLGWHAADDREVYTLEELCQAFSLERVNKAGAVFDLTKLDWMNAQYLRELPLEQIAQRCASLFKAEGLDISDPEKFHRALEAARPRCTLLPDLVEYCRMFYAEVELKPEDNDIIHQAASQSILRWFSEHLPEAELGSSESINAMINKAIADTGLKGKAFYTPLRLALLGQPHGPDLPTTFMIFSQKELLLRLGKYLR